ncbi:MAG: hypothetical protein DRI99_06500 [Candidatus Aminicenantes bacterium]|nr:MAG: hypothetical protein DRJ11_12075 [Candidatus Aminicenantes bacterium]RLE02058.1 MAG: hypothetical protein DRI99_06500 [Candidatus Aminicenantes bacterium]
MVLQNLDNIKARFSPFTNGTTLIVAAVMGRVQFLPFTFNSKRRVKPSSFTFNGNFSFREIILLSL